MSRRIAAPEELINTLLMAKVLCRSDLNGVCTSRGTSRSPKFVLQTTQGIVWLSLLPVLLEMCPSRSGAGHRLSCSQMLQKSPHPCYSGSD